MDKIGYEELKQHLYINKGKIIGGIIGLIIGILFITLGLWKTMLLVLCTAVGYYLGSRMDVEKDFRKLLDKLLPPHSR